MFTVLVFEDMRWADEATVDLLRFLGRRLRNTSVLLIATYRDDAWTADDRLRLALGELADAPDRRAESLLGTAVCPPRFREAGRRQWPGPPPNCID